MIRVLSLFVTLSVLVLVSHAKSSNIAGDTLTISGVSAGGAMAVQFQFAWSSTIRAVGVIAGVPYMCAQGLLPVALDCMSLPSLINNQELIGLAEVASDIGTIDNIDNIKRHAVMLFSGTLDTVVAQGTMFHLSEMYQSVGVVNLVKFFNYSAEHAWITESQGNACNYLGEPYVNKCGLDFAGKFFEMAFNSMQIKFNYTRGVFRPQNLQLFDQTQYWLNEFNSMDSEGYVYIPSQCNVNVSGSANTTRKRRLGSSTCHVHVNFHGCTMQRTAIGDTYVRLAGLNEWAETNNIVVIYPQTIAVVVNPKACFDWWGYAGEDYALQAGPQQAGINRIIRNVIDNGVI